MNLDDLLWMDLTESEEGPDNVFADPDLLLESSLVSVHVDALSSQVALLIDLRTCPSFGSADTAVLLARGVTSTAWKAAQRSTSFTAWTILGFDVDEDDDEVTLHLACNPGASLTVVATEAFFVTGVVPGIGAGQPDYGDAAAVVRAGVAHWHSPISVDEVQRLQL
ncbi:hypothetical protein CLV92_1267 [Kineococcus xinjiangensis]|uniref:Immunity protein 50 of polymorphic toxin system n=1 Tax=Kineococcus xinjiangensis TaxID=512762 RepID=A0A2S6IBX5_9ACTN|nr:hypothetical protein [Kineococcus xinjiangensis]PPK90198.1 hypothetical protein CLV92_1267 [Kineococcus xinjiangensis]